MAEDRIDTTAAAENPSRRTYIGWILGLCSSVVGVVVAIPLVRFLIYPLSAKAEAVTWSEVGPVSDFANITTPVERPVTVEQLDGWRKTVSEKVVYVTKDSAGQVEVLTSICPHLGCTVQWSAKKDAFACPCHGATFSKDGKCTGGPAPRAMDSLESSVQDGKLMVRYHYYRQLVPEKQIIG